MADELYQKFKWVQLQYPANPGAYMILKEIGGGARAMCFHNDVWQSSLVAIKLIDLQQYSPAVFDSLGCDTINRFFRDPILDGPRGYKLLRYRLSFQV